MNQGLIRSCESQLDLVHRFFDSVLIALLLLFSVAIYSNSWSDKYTITAFSAVMLFSLFARSNGLYQSYRICSLMDEFRPLIISWVWTVAGLLLMGYAFKVTQELSRVSLGIWALTTPLILMAWHRLLRYFLQRARVRGYNTRSVVIVGPRPHVVAHNEEFRSKIKSYMQRHKVKPGMTGLAQIHGYRGETETDDKMRHRVRYDVEYINSWSIWQGLLIVIKTPMALLRGGNAY
jgi:hypothetical protein